MPLITLDQASLAFGHYPLLDHANLQLDAGERIGLIGRNGAGKSSLLKVIAGEMKLDDGSIWRAPSVRIVYVPQEPQLDPSHTVFEAVAEGLGALQKILVDYHAVTHRMAEPGAVIDILMQEMQRLQHELDAQDGWQTQAKVETVLSRLNLDADAQVANLSGGWRKRVALGRALVANPEVLLLDEPTNHLDLEAIEWLEELLLNFSGSVLFITHDRRFLDRLATRIVELDRGHLTEFVGNFSNYQVKKEELLAVEATHAAKFDKVLAQEEAWIRQGIKARRTRNEGRVRRLEQLRLERAARRERQGNVKLHLDSGERSGKLVAELDNVKKSFGDKVPINGFSTRILRGDRIGLLGPNGAGKTTLLKLILGELEPDSGTIKRGTNLNVAYFDQMREQLNEEASLADTISPGSDFVEIGGERKHVISYLEDFLFPPQRARSPVKSLSGGERNRLLLARLFARPANVLVLDEPTNDLDIDTLELLETLLQDFPGTLFLVSHDRAFLENTVTQVIAFEGNGVLTEFGGGYDDWRRFSDQRAMERQAAEKAAASKPSLAKPAEKPKSGKLSYQETRELEQLPERIEALEAEQSGIHARLADAEIYREQPEEVKALQLRLETLEKELAAAMERWEDLESRH
ncbi:MAG TPA: ATP-binding cassette domain-containing protein [Methylophilaceae bacterium]|nr:ATP-binding cassette domain-containing protein [Methylophilaceae bacterium]